MTRNYLISLSAPLGTATTELDAAYKAGLLCPSLPRGVIAERGRRRLVEL